MDIDLTGIVDLHLHSGPDTRPRLYDDIDLARRCAASGLRAIMIKSHVTLTAHRATIAQKVVPGIRVCGGLALNAPVGGLNPAAVETAIRLGAKQIWMPTSSAAHHIAFHRSAFPERPAPIAPGITVLQEDGSLLPAVHEILRLVAEAGIMLGTAHLSPREIAALVPAAQQTGVHRIVITHPGLAISSVSLEQQCALVGRGVWFEHCFVQLGFSIPTPIESIIASIRTLGAERTILTSDLGLAGHPDPIDGWRSYLSTLLQQGIPWADLEHMTKKNPAELIDL